MNYLIENYNRAFNDLCYEFTKRFLEDYDEEVTEEDIKQAYRIIGFDTIGNRLAPHMVAINEERYFDIGDMWETIYNNIPINILKKRYDLNIETEGKPGINLVNFWRFEVTAPEIIEKERKEEIEESEANLKKSLILFYKELGMSEEKAIKQFNEIIKK